MEENEKSELTTAEQLALEKKVYNELCAPFDLSCYSVDSSRGFDLSSLKAAYVFDRLNLVLGLTNWQFTGSFEKQDEGGTVFYGQLVVKIGDRTKRVEGVGFGRKGKNIADTLKSAQTDSLSKCASYVGVAIESFKGLIDPNDIKSSLGNSKYEPKKKKPEEKKPEEKKPEEKKPVKKSFMQKETTESEDW